MKHTFEKQQPVNRLGNALPRIGIRPVIDGRRRGIREAQEERIMGLAHVVADFLTANLKHSCGLPVECVVADTCIAGIAEANMCEEKFAKENVGVSISVTACWCYGSETMDMDPIRPKAIWGLNATEAPGAVYLAAVLAAHAQKGLPAYGIYGHDVQDKDEKELTDDVKEKLLRFARAALAVATMRGKTYVSMGGTSMGIAGSIVDHDLFQEYLGMRVMHVDMSEFVRRWEEGIYDPEEYEKAITWAKENLTFGPDFYNEPEKQHSPEKQAEVLETCVKMTMIARDLMIGNPKLAEMGFVEESMGHNGIAGGFQGQRQWTDHFPNGDLMESLLNSSFDWTGIREPFVLATENDCLNGIAMLFGKLLTNRPTVFADVRTYWSPDAVKRVTGWQPEGLAANGFIHLINSGSASLDGAGEMTEDGTPVMKPWWDMTEEEAGKCLDATQYCYANLGYFRGGGFSSHFVSKGGMPVTMIRLNMVKGLGPVLQLAEGWTCELPEEAHHILDMRTDPAWPTTWFAPRITGEGAFTDVYSVMNNWGANHGAFAYGHIGADVITLAAMLRIPVCMHNVPEEKIFRPSTWNAFGTQDREGADYRACAALGPVYR